MTRPAPSLAPALLVYTAARLGLVAVVAGVLLVAGVPLLLAVLIGLIVALPLSMVLLTAPRARLDAALAAAGSRRSAERDALRARLRGDEAAAPSECAAEPQPDRGEHRPAE